MMKSSRLSYNVQSLFMNRFKSTVNHDVDDETNVVVNHRTNHVDTIDNTYVVISEHDATNDYEYGIADYIFIGAIITLCCIAIACLILLFTLK